MSSLCSCNHTVRPYYYITVKVYIHFQRRQNYIIQFINKGTFVKRICIRSRTDSEMIRILHIFDRIQVEILCIQQTADHTAFQKITHRFCQTAYTKSHLDSTIFHNFGKRNRRSNRSTAYTCLIGKTIFKKRSIGNYLCTVFRHQKLSLICCRFCRPCCNFCRITDFINNTYIIHSLHRYMCRIIRKRHKTVRNRNYFICMISINMRIRKNTTVCFTADTTAVSIIVAGRCADKCNINVRFACNYGSYTTTMGTHDSKTFQFSL